MREICTMSVPMPMTEALMAGIMAASPSQIKGSAIRSHGQKN
jgi:hypothetical protein